MTRRVLSSYGMGIVALTAGIMLAGTSSAGEYPIAGVSPHERLAGAPVKRSVSKGPQWYERALTGLERPYPSSFRFLEDQGNWNTPFNRPGMPEPYDIRGWYGP